MEITTKLEFDAGHRIPHHKSSCKNLHGHRYALEVTIKGQVISDKSSLDFGMVMDFKDAKELIKKTIVEEWDHSFIVYKDDTVVLKFLESLDDHKTVIFPLDKACIVNKLTATSRRIRGDTPQTVAGRMICTVMSSW